MTSTTAVSQAMSVVILLVGITIVTSFLTKRLSPLSSLRDSWQRMNWPRLCIVLIFPGFISFSLCFGHPHVWCQSPEGYEGMRGGDIPLRLVLHLVKSPDICIFVPFLITMLIFLVAEKVYMVWDTGRSRLRSPVYVLCMVTVAVYGAIVGLMAIGGIAELRQTDGVCVIGLKPTASIPLLSYDLYINILLTSLFLWPLFRSQHSTARLRRVAARTLIASAVALTTSTINMTILTVLHGRELGWICLASCGTDVVFNASALFWVTSGTSQSSLSGTSSVRHEATNLKPNLIAFPAPPSPGRSHFKVDAPLSPSQGAFAKEDKQTYEMGSLSPTAARFQIQPITQVFKRLF